MALIAAAIVVGGGALGRSAFEMGGFLANRKCRKMQDDLDKRKLEEHRVVREAGRENIAARKRAEAKVNQIERDRVALQYRINLDKRIQLAVTIIQRVWRGRINERDAAKLI